MVTHDHVQRQRVITLALLAISIAGFATTIVLIPRTQRRVVHPAAPPAAHVERESACARLATRLCTDLGAESSACRLARRETSSFREPHCDGMLDRYSQSLSELEALDDGVRALTAPEQRTAHAAAPSVGSATARLTLVEFCDFDSADCARASGMAHVVSNLYADRVRLVFRQYPSAKSPSAQLSAEASLAAHAQGKFWEYADLLFSNPQDASRPALERYAAALQLDLKAFRRALDEHTFAEDVKGDVILGHRVQALDRPTLFANGQRVAVPYGVSELTRLIEAEISTRAP